MNEIIDKLIRRFKTNDLFELRRGLTYISVMPTLTMELEGYTPEHYEDDLLALTNVWMSIGSALYALTNLVMIGFILVLVDFGWMNKLSSTLVNSKDNQTGSPFSCFWVMIEDESDEFYCLRKGIQECGKLILIMPETIDITGFFMVNSLSLP